MRGVSFDENGWWNPADAEYVKVMLTVDMTAQG